MMSKHKSWLTDLSIRKKLKIKDNRLKFIDDHPSNKSIKQLIED